MRQYRYLILSYLLSHGLAMGENSPFGLKSDDLGLQLMPYGARERAMGASGMASGDGGASPLNPARAAFNPKTSFSASFEGDVDYLRDDVTSNRTGAFALPFIGMDFRAGRLGNLGVLYWQRFSREFSFAPMESAGNVKQSLDIEGGLHEIVANWAYPLGRHIAVGVGYHWLLGRERTIFASEFPGLPEGARDLTGDTLRVNTSGGYPAASAMYRHRLFNLALSVSAGADLDVRSKRAVTGLETPDWQSSEKEFPWGFAVGGAYKPAPDKTISADYSTLLFEEEDGLDPSHLVGVGYEKAGTGGLYDPYFRKIALRAGGGYEFLSKDGANHYFVAFGTGLPLGNRGGILDVALTYGHRGFAETSLMAEDYVKLTLSLTGVGNWGQPSRKGR